jgi:hypothetical protein
MFEELEFLPLEDLPLDDTYEEEYHRTCDNLKTLQQLESSNHKDFGFQHYNSLQMVLKVQTSIAFILFITACLSRLCCSSRSNLVSGTSSFSERGSHDPCFPCEVPMTITRFES